MDASARRDSSAAQDIGTDQTAARGRTTQEASHLEAGNGAKAAEGKTDGGDKKRSREQAICRKEAADRQRQAKSTPAMDGKEADGMIHIEPIGQNEIRYPRTEPAPIVVPKTPALPPRDWTQWQPPEKKGNLWLLLLLGGIVAAFTYGESPAPLGEALPKKRRGTKHGLSGGLMNCGIWQEVPSLRAKRGLTWRCLKYGPACEGQPRCFPSGLLPPGKSRQIKVCTGDYIEVKPKSPRYKKPTIKRCKEYTSVCKQTKACLPETMPIPEPEPEPEISQKEVEGVARWMAEEFNRAQAEAGPYLAREILSRGGIAPYRGGYLKEEYKEIPLHLRNRRGLKLDEMASEMNMDEAQLIAAIQDAYPKGQKTVRRANWKDFTDRAYDMIVEEYRQGIRTFGGIGQEQSEFWKLRRELVLEPEDIATSDDPLEICLQRGGWDLRRVAELQESIGAKLTPDMFTGKTTPLSPSEKELQRYIDECYKRMARARETGNPEQLLSGQMMTCAKWQVRGKEPNEYIRCVRYAPTCRPSVKCITESPTKPVKTPTRKKRERGVAKIRNAVKADFTRQGITLSKADLEFETLKEILGGYRDVADALDAMSTMAESDVLYTPRGLEVRKQGLIQAIDTSLATGFWSARKPPIMVEKEELSPEEWAIMQAMVGKKMHIDEIGKKSGLPPYQVSSALVMLELKNLVRQSAGKMFQPTLVPAGRRS